MTNILYHFSFSGLVEWMNPVIHQLPLQGQDAEVNPVNHQLPLQGQDAEVATEIVRPCVALTHRHSNICLISLL
jgi:hypothetical protein